MALTKVIDIVKRAEKLLQDENAVRWTRLEIQDWLNDAYKEVVILRPDANTLTATVTLAANSTRQKLGDAGSINLPSALRVIDVVRNMASSSDKSAVQLIDRRILDGQRPTWHAETASLNIKHWMFDPRVPKEFLVYPPVTSGAQVELAYSQVPAGHALTENQLNPTGGDTTTINLDDIYANVLLDYVLFRAYSKDVEYAANSQRAGAYYQAFQGALAGKTQVDVATLPNNVTPAMARTN